jgi:hypothetical protein
MRPFIVIAIAGGLLSCSKPPAPVATATAPFVPPPPAPPSLQAPICAKPIEKQALEVSVLMSQLQVVTVTCHTEEKYNALVPHLRPALATNEKNLDGFFSRAYGKRAVSMHDEYITELANQQSQLGVRSGDQFCRLNTALFDDVTPLSTPDQLAAYAESKPLQQAMAVNDCPATPAVTPPGKSKPKPQQKP